MTSRRCLVALAMVLFAHVTSLACRAADEVDLKLIGKTGTIGQDAAWYFKLTVTGKSTWYVLADRVKVSGPSQVHGGKVHVMPFQMEQRMGIGWKPVDLMFCPDVAPMALRAGQHLVVKVDHPDIERAWRIGLSVYPKVPAANVPATEVWSDVVPGMRSSSAEVSAVVAKD